MGEPVIVALITGFFAILGNIIISKQTTKDLYAKLEKESVITDTRIESKMEKYLAVTEVKIEELTREVREHNNFAKRIPVLEEKIHILETKG